MCGIGGIYTTSGASFPIGEVKCLWESLEDRGTHAAGTSWLWEDADKPLTYKKPKPASAISEVVERMEGKNTRYALFHTRYTTQGSTEYNGNNHPVLANRIILTHNGMLSNDNRIFDITQLKRLHEVDSEAINAGLRYGGIEFVAKMIIGSISIAWVDITQNQQNVNLFTNGRNPLVIARVNGGQVVWASSLDHIEDAGFEIETHFNADPYKIYTLNRDTKGEVLITSKRVVDRMVEPMVVGRYRHAASYAQQVGYTSPSTKKSKKTVKTTFTGKETVFNGMVYDPETQSWSNWRR